MKLLNTKYKLLRTQNSELRTRQTAFVFIPLIMSLAGGMGGAALGGAIGGTMFGMTMAQVGGMLGAMGGGLLGQTLFPPEHNTPWPQADNYPIQKSSQGPPIDKFYGTVKKAGHVIWEGDMNPYAIKQDVGGGKGGGSDTVTTGFGYRQSFLIDLGEGPGQVLRIWANNKLIYPYNSEGVSPRYIYAWNGADPSYVLTADVTIFNGDNNTGVKDLTGLDYGEWPHNVLVFFNEYDLGTSNVKPNFTFEVKNYLTNYFLGIYPAGTNKIVCNAKDDSTVNTDWGDNGYWEDGVVGSVVHALYQLSDGRILCSHSTDTVTMIGADGITDTSWATNGSYNSGTSQIIAILEDNNGNFHLIGHAPDTGTEYIYYKLDSDGNFITGITWNTAYTGGFNDAIWYDNNKTRIIAVGHYNAYNPDRWNVMAINAATGAVDTTWEGNVSGHPGYARMLYDEMTQVVYKIRRTSDGGFILYFNDINHMLAKMLSNGTALDTTWGSSGILDINYSIFPNSEADNIIVDSEDNIYLIMNYSGTTTFYKIDSDGVIVDSHDETGAENTYSSICELNDQLIISKGDYCQIWDKEFVYESQFQVANATYILKIIPYNAEAIDKTFAYMAKDMLTNTRYGAGFTGMINEASFNTMINYCLEKGFIGSLNLNQQRNWRDWLDVICAHFGGYYYESGDELFLNAYRDRDLSSATVLSAANHDFVVDNPDKPGPLIRVKEREESETYNRIKVAWTDRENDYATAITIAQDVVDQRVSGTVREKTYNLPGIMTESLAQKMAYRLLFESMYRFKIYTFMLSYKNMLCEVGDVRLINDGDKIIDQQVLFLKIDEDINGRGLAVTAIEDVSELYPEIDFTSQSSLRAETESVSLSDAAVNFRESDITNELYLSVTPGNAYVNGFFIYKSYDDTTYELLGRCTIDGVTSGDANSSGTIAGNLPSHGSLTWSPDESVLVSIGTVTDLHTDISENQFWNDLRLAKIGDEIISFRDAEETATAGIWRISCLRRGLFGTEPVAHSSGESFCTLDKDFTYRYTETDIGKTLYFKAVAFYGDIAQNVSNVDGESVEVEGLAVRPAPASLLRLNSDENEFEYQYEGASFTLYWNLGSRVSGFNYGDWLNLPWDNYTEDDELQAVHLYFETESGTAITDREIAVGESTTITKATDLGGNDRAVIKVVPRRTYESKLKNSILIESI